MDSNFSLASATLCRISPLLENMLNVLRLPCPTPPLNLYTAFPRPSSALPFLPTGYKSLLSGPTLGAAAHCRLLSRPGR